MTNFAVTVFYLILPVFFLYFFLNFNFYFIVIVISFSCFIEFPCVLCFYVYTVIWAKLPEINLMMMMINNE